MHATEAVWIVQAVQGDDNLATLRANKISIPSFSIERAISAKPSHLFHGRSIIHMYMALLICSGIVESFICILSCIRQHSSICKYNITGLLWAGGARTTVLWYLTLLAYKPQEISKIMKEDDCQESNLLPHLPVGKHYCAHWFGRSRQHMNSIKLSGRTCWLLSVFMFEDPIKAYFTVLSESFSLERDDEYPACLNWSFQQAWCSTDVSPLRTGSRL